jgi:hypothetical protein
VASPTVAVIMASILLSDGWFIDMDMEVMNEEIKVVEL